MKRGKVLLFAIIASSVALGGAWFTPWVQTRFAGYQLSKADSEDARTTAVNKLLTMGDRGTATLADTFRTGSDETRTAIVMAIKTLDATDSRVASFANVLMERFPVEHATAVSLFPTFLQTRNETVTIKVNLAIEDVLARGSDASKQELAAVAAIPGVKPGLMANLLKDANAEVRRATLVVLGNPTARGVVPPEDLFAAAHDTDADNRALAKAALASTGLSAGEVAAGVQLASPNAADRLALLFALRWGQTGVKDPGPWLAKLATDAEPGVRVAAVRVALELGLRTGGWDKALADSDTDLNVRRLAQFFRELPHDVRSVDFRP